MWESRPRLFPIYIFGVDKSVDNFREIWQLYGKSTGIKNAMFIPHFSKNYQQIYTQISQNIARLIALYASL